MIIVAGGDSFVYGSELADCNDTYSKNTFSSLLSDNNEYICAAWPGFGNDSIARTVVNTCESQKGKELFVIVSWTFPGRYEFRFSYDTGQRTSPWYTIAHWSIQDDISAIEKEYVTKNDSVLKIQQEHINKAKTTGVNDFAKVFYKHIGSSEYWEIYSSLKEVVYLQNYLKANNIPFLFTCADNILFYSYTIKNADDSLRSLIGQIDHNTWFLFPEGHGANQTENPRGFYQWAKENKYPIGTTHPLEQAHSDAAQLMKDKFNELVQKSLE